MYLLGYCELIFWVLKSHYIGGWCVFHLINFVSKNCGDTIGRASKAGCVMGCVTEEGS